MSAQFLGQARQDGYVALCVPFGVGDVNLGRISVKMQIFYLNVDKLRHASAGHKQGFNHQTVFAMGLIGTLNEPLDFGLGQSLNGAPADIGRLQGQVTPGLLDHIFGLVVAQMVSTPQSCDLINDFAQSRNCVIAR